MALDLDGRSALVTGGSRGIGLAIAEELLHAGASVLITGRSQSALEAALRRLTPHGPVASAQADVSRADDCRRAAQIASTSFGGIDIVVANAGIYPPASLEEMTEEQIDTMLAVNVKGTISTVQAAIPFLRRSGHGRVIVISSITGTTTGLPGWSHYAASKAAQVGFVRTAALELAGDGITVNAVLAGNTRTEGVMALGDDYSAAMIRSIPLGRLAEPADIAHACVFLASDEASFITGQTLTVDGGQVLPESRD